MASGEHVGAIHLRSRIPGQDRVASGTVVHGEQTFKYGLCLDGNSSGKNSEFGSIIGRYHLEREINRLLTDGTPLQEIPQYLFDSLEDELRRLLPQHATKRAVVEFILNYLIFTVVGFIQGPEETIVFYVGDGIVEINGVEVVGSPNQAQQKGAPDGIGYRLMDRLDAQYWASQAGLRGSGYRPINHFTVILRPTSEIQTLAIGSDSWLQEREYDSRLLSQLVAEVDFANPDYVQERINMWAGAPHRTPRSQVYFEDDVSAVILTRKENGE
ncbi:MAG: hypothetical protein SGJ04_01200 [Bacteroidota bacterium]|nr:hypothetical protein [Bacteroidota bacterium]